MNPKWALSLVLATTVVACSDGSRSPRTTTKAPPDEPDANPPGHSVGGSDGCDSLDLEPPMPGHGVQIVTEMTLEPGTERQTCKLLMTGEDINFNYGDGIFTEGSHHATVWRTSHLDTIPTRNVEGQTLDTSGPVDCLSTGDFNGTGVVATGRNVNTDPNIYGWKDALPDDVAFKIRANEVLVMNFHMANLTDHTVHACYKQNLPSLPAEQVKQEAGLMFFYNDFVTVPASSTAKADMACPVTADITVSTAASHMHRRGIGYTATLLDGDPIAGGKEIQQLYQSTEWEEPVARSFKPALQLKTGQWIRWECDFKNTESRDVAQGQQTTDEMCMFVGAYWPRNPGWEQCGVNGAGRMFGTGTMDGKGFIDCWNKSVQRLGLYGGGAGDAANRYAAQRCVTESCPAVSALANDYIYRGDQAIVNATCD